MSWSLFWYWAAAERLYGAVLVAVAVRSLKRVRWRTARLWLH